MRLCEALHVYELTTGNVTRFVALDEILLTPWGGNLPAVDGS